MMRVKVSDGGEGGGDGDEESCKKVMKENVEERHWKLPLPCVSYSLF